MAQYRSTITRGGQVTLPSRIRKKLGLKLGDPVVFREDGDTVVVERPRFTVRELAGSVPALKHPTTDREMTDVAWNEAVEHHLKVLRSSRKAARRR